MTQGAENPQGLEVTAEEKINRGRELEEKLTDFKNNIDNRLFHCDVYITPEYPYIDPTSQADNIEEFDNEDFEDGDEDEGDVVHKFTVRLSRSSLDNSTVPTNFEIITKEIQEIIKPYKDIMIEGSYEIKNVPVGFHFVHVVLFTI